jgi:NAD(P)H-dependent FMN reductase
MPEYNQGYSAPLKNAIDFLYSEWHDKPVAFVSYGMTSGGLRAATAIKPVVSAVKMMPIVETVVIHLRQTLDVDGRLVPTSAMRDAAKAMLDELLRMTGAFQVLRAVG